MADTSSGSRRGRVIVALVLLLVLVAGTLGAVIGTGGGDDSTSPEAPTTGPLSTVDEETGDGQDRQRTEERDAENGPTAAVDEDDRALPAPRSRFPDREASPGDREAEIGDGLRVGGRRVRVDSAQHIDGQLVLDVVVDGRASRPRPYSERDWSLELPDGQPVVPAANGRDDALGSGVVTDQDRAEGTVVFDVDPGTYFAVFAPDGPGRRGVWRIAV